jgi:hypothetical protein
MSGICCAVNRLDADYFGNFGAGLPRADIFTSCRQIVKESATCHRAYPEGPLSLWESGHRRAAVVGVRAALKRAHCYNLLPLLRFCVLG